MRTYFDKDFSFRVPAQICRQESKCLMAMLATLTQSSIHGDRGSWVTPVQERSRSAASRRRRPWPVNSQNAERGNAE